MDLNFLIRLPRIQQLSVIAQGARHTGNTEGKSNTGGNTTVTPIPYGPSRDDFIYLTIDKDNNVTKAIIDSKKFDYLFVNVASNSHNSERSTQLAQAMDRLGLESNAKEADLLTEHFRQGVNAKGNVIDTYTRGNRVFEVRESLLFGPSEKVTKLETSFEIMPDSSRRFITTIPKEGKK